MHKTVVINIVGLTPSLLGEHTPALSSFAKSGKMVPIGCVLPAVTCSVQATYLTGVLPEEHGIVGNGWYFRDECEVRFWRQSNHLVRAPKIWEQARKVDPSFTCANLFWWYNMYSSVDYSITPRPMYSADGRKAPDIYTAPANIREDVQRELGRFPLFDFWGPSASIRASKWIADSAQWVDQRYDPTLTLVYLPHLDYELQRSGPEGDRIKEDLRAIDSVFRDLVDYYRCLEARIIVLSEYGITSVERPIHINRILREANLLSVREEFGRELLDCGASAAFAVSDHQVAHVYIKDSSLISFVRELLSETDGIGQVLGEGEKRRYGIAHPRAGDLLCLAEPNAWFTYYFWLDDDHAPDFSRTVDIHRKPGYDPAELFVDPKVKFPKIKIACCLGKKMLGFRSLMDVIGLDASLIKGSHGLVSERSSHGPLLISNCPDLIEVDRLAPTSVCDTLLNHLGIGKKGRHLTANLLS